MPGRRSPLLIRFGADLELAGGLSHRSGERLRQAGYASRLYAHSLRGRVPRGLVCVPENIRPGDPALANTLFQGRYAFAGKEAVAPGQPPWGLPRPSQAWAAELHGFAWLRHFSACGGAAARQHARELVRTWIEQASAWEAVSWRPEVLGRRLGSWLSQAPFLLEGADSAFRAAFLASLAEQSRHLSRTAARASDGVPRLSAVGALTLSGLCLEDGAKRQRRGLSLLGRELARQIQADGGHVSRNPSAQLQVLTELVVLRGALVAARREVPAELPAVIGRMAPMLGLLRHGDGRLALFNGGCEESAEFIDIALARADACLAPLEAAPSSGFQRLAAGPAVVLADCGPPPPAPGIGAHAGTLSVELSLDEERLIVNCGSAREQGPDWARATRTTAAHSTLGIADSSSSEIKADGRLGRTPGGVVSSRREESGGLWLEASHDGYVRPYGVVHHRRLHLGASGDELRGQDLLIAPGAMPSAGPAVAIRFHLHPGVRASLAQDGTAVWLRLPGGTGWRFGAAGGALGLEESVYLGSGTPRRSEQIVVSGRLAREELDVRWTLARVRSGT